MRITEINSRTCAKPSYLETDPSQPGPGGLNKYPFKRREHPIVTGDVASEILRAVEIGRKSVKTSIDLWKSCEELEVGEGHVWMRGIPVGLNDLREVVGDERSIYAVFEEGLRRLEIRGEHFYKLVQTGKGHAPTIEIDGIHMHRVAGASPERDAYEKVRAAGRRLKGAAVLDICTGLGYTASMALRLGAELVVTIEKDINVLRLAEFNPWSWDIESGNVVVFNEDASKALVRMPESFFNVVIHDPPRFSFAGELYSVEFYRELFRVLRPPGVLVHYVGRPGERFRGVRLRKGVMQRLRGAGFEVRWIERVDVVVAAKRG